MTFGIVTLINDEHPLNVDDSIDVTPFGIVILVNDVQL